PRPTPRCARARSMPARRCRSRCFSRTPLDRTLSVPVVLYGRRHEPGILPRTRTVLAARRVLVPPGSTEAELALGLEALGSWTSGAPVAVPARMQVWAEPVLEAPAGAVEVRVRD